MSINRRRNNNYYATKKARHASVLSKVLIGIAAILFISIVLTAAFGGFNGINEPTSTDTVNIGTPTSQIASTDSPLPSATPSNLPIHAKIQMMGDVLLHDTSRESGKQADGSYDFTSYFDLIAPYLDGNLVIANMESPIDANLDGTGFSGYPAFNVPREIVTAVKKAGINFVTTCNNHALDRGWKGVVNTRTTLTNMGLNFYGTFETKQEYDTPKIINVNGIKVGFLAYADSSNGLLPTIPEQYQGFVLKLFNSSSTNDLPRLIADVDATRAAGAEFIIFYMHWGTEYQYVPTNGMKAYAQALIDDGVDVIMGDHPHCVEPIVKKTVNFKGVDKQAIIIYSLGNFFADQIKLSTDKQTDDRIRQSMIVDLTIEKNSLTGKVSLVDADYMPTFIHRDTLVDGATPRYAYKVLPAGKYALEQTRPSVFDTDAKWQLCKDAWLQVPKVVGNQITIKKG